MTDVSSLDAYSNNLVLPNPQPSASDADTSIPMSTVTHTPPETSHPLESHALESMRHVLRNPGIDWRSAEQKTAMMATLEQRTDVVAVLVTGGGKSMLAVITSLVEEVTATILVLPLNSLLMDYQHCLTQMQVPYQVHGEGNVDQDEHQLEVTKNLVLVSADKAQMSGWQSALAILNQKKPVARLVFDEAHIPLIAKGYCRSLEDIYQVRSVPM